MNQSLPVHMVASRPLALDGRLAVGSKQRCACAVLLWIMRTVTSGVQATTFAHPPHFSDVIRFPVSEASEPVLREGITSRLQTQVTGEVYVRSWLCGCLRLVSKPIAPTWDLALILNFKISLHMTLVMAKHVGDLQVLSVQTFCTQFTRATKVTLSPNATFSLKVMAMSYRCLALSHFHFRLLFLLKRNRSLNVLCELYARSANPARGRAVHKQHVSHWIVESLRAYYSRGQGLNSGVRAHSTSGPAAYWAWFKWLSVGYICAAVSWASPYTFVMFHCLDVTAPSSVQCVYGWDGESH